jgi:hypothetical protein
MKWKVMGSGWQQLEAGHTTVESPFQVFPSLKFSSNDPESVISVLTLMFETQIILFSKKTAVNPQGGWSSVVGIVTRFWGG